MITIGKYFLPLLLTPSLVYSQTFDRTKSLKDYSKQTIITSQVRSEGNKAILRGSESKKIGSLYYQIITEFRYQFIQHGILDYGLNKNLIQLMIMNLM